MYKLYLDDVRPTPEGYDLRAFTAKDAINLIQLYPVSHISFDHDLGDDEKHGTGYTVASWIERQAAENPDFQVPSFHIHSANPVGARAIQRAMESAQRFELERQP